MEYDRPASPTCAVTSNLKALGGWSSHHLQGGGGRRHHYRPHSLLHTLTIVITLKLAISTITICKYNKTKQYQKRPTKNHKKYYKIYSKAAFSLQQKLSHKSVAHKSNISREITENIITSQRRFQVLLTQLLIHVWKSRHLQSVTFHKLIFFYVQ